MSLKSILMTIFGLEYVDVQSTTTNPVVHQKITTNPIPSLEETSSTTNMFVENNPTNEEIIKYYQSLRNQPMDHSAAWAKVTQKYNWDTSTSENKLTEITEFIKKQKEKHGGNSSKDSDTTKKNRQL